MKKALFVLMLLASEMLLAQDTVTNNEIHDFSALEKKPEFPGGLQSFYQFIAENYVMPENPELKSGRIFASFTIEQDGTITDVKSLRDLGYGTGEEAVRVLQKSPKWHPGELNGLPVRVRYSIPIKLDVPEWAPEPAMAIVPTSGCQLHRAEEIEIKAEFPGGLDRFFDFVTSRFKIPDFPADGKVFVTFVIQKDGSLTDIKVIRDMGHGSSAETIRVLKQSPKWKPAKSNGENVCSMLSLPITIKGMPQSDKMMSQP